MKKISAIVVLVLIAGLAAGCKPPHTKTYYYEQVADANLNEGVCGEITTHQELLVAAIQSQVNLQEGTCFENATLNYTDAANCSIEGIPVAGFEQFQQQGDPTSIVYFSSYLVANQLDAIKATCSEYGGYFSLEN